MTGGAKHWRREGRAWGAAFVDEFVAAAYGKELVSGGEDGVVAIFLERMAVEGQGLMRQGLRRDLCELWARSARDSCHARLREIQATSAALAASGEPRVQ